MVLRKAPANLFSNLNEASALFKDEEEVAVEVAMCNPLVSILQRHEYETK